MLSQMEAYTRFKGHPKFREINITMISIYNDHQVNEICRVWVSPQIIFLQLFELLHDMWDHTMDLTRYFAADVTSHSLVASILTNFSSYDFGSLFERPFRDEIGNNQELRLTLLEWLVEKDMLEKSWKLILILEYKRQNIHHQRFEATGKNSSSQFLTSKKNNLTQWTKIIDIRLLTYYANRILSFQYFRV